MNKNHYM